MHGLLGELNCNNGFSINSRFRKVFSPHTKMNTIISEGHLGCFSCIYSTWNLHLEQRENFDQEYWDPAEGIREHDEKEAVGHSHVSAQLCGINTCLVDGVEHAGVGDDDDEEGY